MNPVVHFEMPYGDPDRVSKFYQAAFGWNMKSLGEQMGGYVLAGTTESSPDGMPKQPGAINGGFFAKTPDLPDHLPSVVIAVDDIKQAMAKVASAGGKVLGAPMAIPGIGDYVSFKDSEGNRVGILEPLPMAKSKPAKKAPAASKKPTATRRRKSAR